MRYAIYTLGCKVNQYETQAMETILTGRGHTLTEFDAEADVYIINTCSVTAVSDKKCRNMIRRTKRTHPDALIAVCGCYAQAKPEEVAGLEVDLVAGTGDRMAFLDQVEQAALGRRNYTVLTLEMLARTYPKAELYMAMGSDMLLSFDSWHRWQEILRLARLVVTSRNVGDAPELHAKAKQMDPTGARILFAQVEALPMASSNLRARLAAGEACENELPALVRRVIRREGLYRADRGESGNHESETGKGACARPVE